MPFTLPPLNTKILEANTQQIEDKDGDSVWTVNLTGDLDNLFAISTPTSGIVGKISFQASILESSQDTEGNQNGA